MGIYKVIFELLFAKYQLHIFTVIVVFAYQQFKTNKRIEVQIAKCEGRFILQEYKIQDVEKDLNKHINQDNMNAVNLFVKGKQ